MFLDRLTPDEVAELERRARRRRWPRGAILIHEGERSDRVLVLLTGRAITVLDLDALRRRAR